jgi:diacylglycerol kinase (ATP)
MSPQPGPADPKIAPPRSGPLHVLDAARYSLAGVRRLLGETAARLELWGAAAGGLALVWRGAHLWHWAVFALLVALVLAVEALNTAIEILTDHISPDWSQMAKDAKDLGSLAVGLMLAVTAGFLGLVVAGLV